jgi:uncharacterized protein (DUF2164 family)
MPSKTITLSDSARKQSIASIKRYFADELDQDIGDLKAGLLLEFFLKEIGPSVHNRAIESAQAFIRDRLEDLEGACAVQEFAYWRPAAKRSAS